MLTLTGCGRLRSIISSPMPSCPASPIPNASNFALGAVSILNASVTGGSGNLASRERREFGGRPRPRVDVVAKDEVDADLDNSFGFLAGDSVPRDERFLLLPLISCFSSSFSSFSTFSFSSAESTAKKIGHFWPKANFYQTS